MFCSTNKKEFYNLVKRLSQKPSWVSPYCPPAQFSLVVIHDVLVDCSVGVSRKCFLCCFKNALCAVFVGKLDVPRRTLCYFTQRVFVVIRAIEDQLAEILHAGERLGINPDDVLQHLRYRNAQPFV